MDFISNIVTEFYLGNTFQFSQEIMYFFKGILVLMLVLPLIGSIIISLIDEYNILLVKKFTLFITVLTFFLLVLILLGLNFYFLSFQLVFSIDCLIYLILGIL